MNIAAKRLSIKDQDGRQNDSSRPTSRSGARTPLRRATPTTMGDKRLYDITDEFRAVAAGTSVLLDIKIS